MPFALRVPKSRFRWSVLHGRCRRRIIAGLIGMTLAVGHGAYATRHFGRRGSDDAAFDQPLVRAARALTPLPRHLRGMTPENNRELYLLAAIADQQDMAFGLILLALRLIITTTGGAIGLVFLTAGSTEWEVRSEEPPPA